MEKIVSHVAGIGAESFLNWLPFGTCLLFHFNQYLTNSL